MNTDPFDIADLLVRCSGVPLARIAAVLGFSEPEKFSRWFENHGGLHPETARAEWETLASADSDGPDQQVLRQMRHSLFSAQNRLSALDRQTIAPMVRAMRDRKPISIQPMSTQPPTGKGDRRA